MKTVFIIPARWKSKRFPGKPLAKINNKELIHHVWDKANKVKNIDKVLIATDDKRIANLNKWIQEIIIKYPPIG